MINTGGVDEALEKYRPGLLHQRFGTFQLLPSFGFPIVAGGSQQQICANNAGEAFRNPGMTFGRDLNCLIDDGEGGLSIAIQSVGIGQVGQNTGFVFQTGLSRSSEAAGRRTNLRWLT